MTMFEHLTRRSFVGGSAMGLGSLAFSMMSQRGLAQSAPPSLQGPQDPEWKLGKAQAKRVVVIFLSGGHFEFPIGKRFTS